MPNVNFRELLDFTSENVQRPAAIPECWLIGVVGQSTLGQTKSESETPFIDLDLGSIEAHPSNPPEVLEALSQMDLTRLRSPYTRPSRLIAHFWLDDENKHRFSDMLDKVIGGKNRSARERLAELANQRVQFKARAERDSEGNSTGQTNVLAYTLTAVAV
jgi:hypothetical protein